MASAISRHRRQRAEQHEAADDFVEQPLHHHVPIGDRPVGDVEHRHLADVGIGARAELQLVGMGRQPDVDRQHPQFLQHLQDAALRRNRQREDHQIDARAPSEFHQVIDRAELALAGAFHAGAIVAAVIEQPDDLDAAVLLPPQLLDHMRAGFAAADDHRAAGEAAFLRPFAHGQETPCRREIISAASPTDVEGAEPYAREHFAGLGEERRADDDEEHQRPGRGEPHVLLLVAAEGLHLIDVGGLEGEHRQHRDAQGREQIAPDEAVELFEVGRIDQKADHDDERELAHAHETCEHDRRDRSGLRLGGDCERFRRQRMRLAGALARQRACAFNHRGGVRFGDARARFRCHSCT